MKVKSQAKNPNINKDTAVPKEKKHTYEIDRLSLVNQAVKSENDSKWLLAQRREGWTRNEKQINNSIKHEYNALYNFLNPTKRTGTKNSHFSPILRGCMNTRSRRAKFKKLQIIFDNRRSSTIMKGKLTPKLKSKEALKNMWETQAGKFTTSKKLNVEFLLPESSVKKIMMWKFHLDDSTNGRYDMVLGRDLLTALRLDIKFSDNIIIGREVPYEGCSSSIVDVINHDFNSIKDKNFKP